MALKDVTAENVSTALREFANLGREAMPERFGGGSKGKSRHWYIFHDRKPLRPEDDSPDETGEE